MHFNCFKVWFGFCKSLGIKIGLCAFCASYRLLSKLFNYFLCFSLFQNGSQSKRLRWLDQFCFRKCRPFLRNSNLRFKIQALNKQLWLIHLLLFLMLRSQRQRGLVAEILYQKIQVVFKINLRQRSARMPKAQFD